MFKNMKAKLLVFLATLVIALPVLAAGLTEIQVKTLDRQFARAGGSNLLYLAKLLGPFGQSVFTNTDGATVAFDWRKGNYQKVTLAGNRTFTFTAPEEPCLLCVEIIQDGTGSRTVTWPTIVWAGGSAPTLTTTAAKVDRIFLWYNGTSYVDFAIVKNYAS